MTRFLGAGAFAWVYEAVDLDLEIPVALKVLRPDFAGAPGAVARFRKEATIAARLRHPNIVNIRDVGQVDEAVFVAMDLLPLSVARRLDVLSRLPEADVIRMALDVAAALAIAHAEGIVHRDIKPDNVLIGANGESIVADFGLARAFSSEATAGETNQLLGTPHYFSPEQARGQDLDGRADLYSLGVTCYRASTGQLPFNGEDWYEVARQHIEVHARPPHELVPELSEGFSRIVMRLLSKNPADRFATATEVVDALLLLPTAPSRAFLRTPVSAASITQSQIATSTDMADAMPARGVQPWMLGIAAVALTAALTIATGVLARNGVLKTWMGKGVTPDSLVKSAVDTTSTPIDSSTPPPTVATPAESIPGRGASPTTVRLEVVTDDSAQVMVNGTPVSKQGSWSGDVSTLKPVRIHAAIRSPYAECSSASRDTTITLRNTQARKVTLPLVPCAVLRIVIRPDESDYTIKRVAAPFDSITGRYRNTPVAHVLPRGTYKLSVRSYKCEEYTSDPIVVDRATPTSTDTVSKSAKLVCR